MAFEYLSAGPPEPAAGSRRGPAPVAVVVAVVAVVVVVVGLATADWLVRNLEMRSLVSAVEASEQAMTDTQQQVRDTFAAYDGRTDVTPQERDAVRGRLTAAAEAGADAVASAGWAVQGVRILPWHADVAAARDAYLAHNQAWQHHLFASAVDPTVLTLPDEAISTTWAGAQAPLRDAVPTPALFDLAERVDAVLVQGSQDDSPQVAA